MATEGVTAPEGELARLVGWIEERRSEDHDRLLELVRLVQQLQDDVREHDVALARGRGQVQPVVEAREPDESLSSDLEQLREHLGIVARALEEHVTAQARGEQVESAARDRDRRQAVELAQQVGTIGRTVEAVAARTLALAEEIRREREGRLPLAQTVDELQKAQTGLQSRLSVVDELTRRHAAFQAAVEQAAEKRQAEVTRLDNQVRLLDVRVARELSELRRATEEWQRTAEEQFKITGHVAKQVTALAEQRDVYNQRVAEVIQIVERVIGQVDRLDAQTKADRAAFGRLVDGHESIGRRIDAAGATAWQLGERAAAMAAEIEDVRGDLKDVTQRLDELIHKVSWSDDDRQRLEAVIATLGNDLRVHDRDWRERTDELLRRFDQAIVTLASRTELRHQLLVEHMRRTVGVFQQQLLELESGST